MGQVRSDDQTVTADIQTGTVDEIAYMDDEKANALLGKHMACWSTLLERLK